MVRIKKAGYFAEDQMGLIDLSSQITFGEWLVLLPLQVLYLPPPQHSPQPTAFLQRD
jgi:hypothetical protein